MINYWDAKTNVFRVLFIAGVAALIFGLPRIGFGVIEIGLVIIVYVAVGWAWLLRFRKVIYADNLLNEKIRQGRA